MTKFLDDFMSIRSGVDRGLPLDEQLNAVVCEMGLESQRNAALRVAPDWTRLGEEALKARMCAKPSKADSAESARSKWERNRREKFEAEGQMSLSLDEARGTKYNDLLRKLSFAEQGYLLDGNLVSAEQILADHLLRAQVRAELASAEAEARKNHCIHLTDFIAWSELCDRHEAVVQAAE